MANSVHRLWTAFLGGGSIVLGVGITHFGFKYSDNRRLFDNCLCEPQYSKSENGNSLDKPQEIHGHVSVFHQNIPDNTVLLAKARALIKRFKEESGSPGLAVSVSVNGSTVWSEGFGYSDVENDVPCTPNTVMRIASISKPLTAVAAMKLLDEGKLNLDDSVQKYVPSFPEKKVNAKTCVITVRHLLSHQSGIRHYHSNKKEEATTATDETKDEKEKTARKKEVSEFEKPEYYIKECYDSVEKSLSLFKDDPLVHEPGSQFLYTTFGWTLLSAVIESAAKKKFLPYMNQLFKDLGMNSTQAELHEKLIHGRARHYVRNKKGKLINTPFVDNCYKLAGGGFLSTSEDLIKFGNAMLYARQVGEYQGRNKDSLLPGILSSESMRLSWTMVENTEGKVSNDWSYGLGWAILPKKHDRGCCRDQQTAVAHTGGAIGASSVLLILPNSQKNTHNVTAQDIPPPNGVVVAILVNMGSVHLTKPALEIAQLFHSFQKN